jgi:hypothetical protein
VQGQIFSIDAVDAGSSLWILIRTPGVGPQAKGVIEEADPSTGATRRRIQLGSSIPYDAILVGTRLWVVTLDGKLLYVEDDHVTEVEHSGPALNRIASDGSYLWTVAENGDVTQRSLTTFNKVMRAFPKLAPTALAFVNLDSYGSPSPTNP